MPKVSQRSNTLALLIYQKNGEMSALQQYTSKVPIYSSLTKAVR